MKDLVDFIIGMVCVIGLIVIFTYFMTIIAEAQCEKTAGKLGYTCEYSILTGCIFEKPDGTKVLYQKLRYSE